jgi:hypothetical protein
MLPSKLNKNKYTYLDDATAHVGFQYGDLGSIPSDLRFVVDKVALEQVFLQVAPLLVTILPLLLTCCHPSMWCVMDLSKQHSIIPLVTR